MLRRRHSRLETVAIYDDSSRDLAGEVAALFAAGVGDVGVAPAERPENGTPDEPGNAHSRAQDESI